MKQRFPFSAVCLAFLVLMPAFLWGQEYEVRDTFEARIFLQKSDSLLKIYELDKALNYANAAKKIYLDVLGNSNLSMLDYWKIMSGIFYYKNDFSSALNATDSTLNLQLRLLGHDHPDIASTYARLGTLQGGQGKYDLALEFHDKALNLRTTHFGISSQEVSDSYMNIGVVFHHQGKYNEAIDYFEKALKIRIALLGNEDVLVARTYGNMGYSSYLNGDYKKVMFYYENALKIFKNTLGENHPNTAQAFNQLGNVYSTLGKEELALEYYNKALKARLVVFGEDNPIVANTYFGFGNLHSKMNNYNVSIQYYEKALKIWLLNYGEEYPHVATCYENIGVIYSDLKNYKIAVELYEKALMLKKKIYGEEHPSIASNHINLGVVYYRKKEFNQARIYYEKALEIRKKIFGINHIQVAESHINVGVTFYEMGDFEEAQKYYKSALDIQRNIFSENHPSIAISYINLAIINLRQQKFEEASNLYEKSLEVLSYRNNDIVAQYNPELLKNLWGFGKMKYDQFLKEGTANHLFKSKELLLKATKLLEYHFTNINDVAQIQLSNEAFSIHNDLIITNLEIYALNKDKSFYRDAFTSSEKTKSYYLREKLKEVGALSYGKIPDTLLLKEYNLRTDITFLEKKRKEAKAVVDNMLDSSILTISNELFTLNRQYDSLKLHLEQNYPDYYRLKYDLSTVEVEEVQQDLLTPQQSLLEYFVGDSTIFAFVINREDYKVVEIKKDFPLEDWVKTFRQANSKKFLNTLPAEYVKVAHQLYKKLVTPVAASLQEEVIIIPDGVLGYVPFEALLVEPVKNEQESNFKAHHYWLKDKQISYCYSATLLREMREKKHKNPATGSLLAFAPFYDGDTTLLADLFRYADDIDKQPLKPLPQSGEEVYGIQKMTNGKVYYHEEATEDNFTKEASNYRMLHLATHGKANDKVGDYSFLTFTEQKDSLENELLYVRDLYNLELNADMVVLSACETGIGELQKGEGIISLARGFTYAGAKSIITSLWSVEDAPTKDLMLTFYGHLKKGLSKDAALRQAKLDFIKNSPFNPNAHPFYWSGFIGIGDMGAIEF